MGVSMRAPSLCCIGYTIVYPSASRADRINLESFQEQHPGQPGQPRAFTSDSMQALVTP